MGTDRSRVVGTVLGLLAALGTAGASGGIQAQQIQDVSDRVGVIEGLSGPEAVRYDPDQDVYFVSNFAGDGGARDGNGFITRADASGTIEQLQFATGTSDAPFHAPRGMFITGDTLWAADIDGVHGFDRRTGAHLTFVDLTEFEPGFLNDVTQGSDGALYVTDTGRSAVYRITDGRGESFVQDRALGNPNGITWDASAQRLLVVPWAPGPSMTYIAMDGTTTSTGPSSWPGRLDGVEIFAGETIVASQSDSTLYRITGDTARGFVRTPGTGADIAVDTRRGRVAVPYIGLNRVDIWRIPGGDQDREQGRDQ